MLFWQRLQAAFPSRVLAACLMPNHLHIIWATGTPELLRQRLATQCRAFTRENFPGEALWEALPPFEPIRDFQKLETTLRYVHLNPCRAKLTDDPWSWEFSTLAEHTLSSLQRWVDWVSLENALPSHFETPRLDAWALRHAQWVAKDAYVNPTAQQRLLDRPELSKLSIDDSLRLLERALALPRGASLRNGTHRPFTVKLLQIVKPESSQRELARLLGMSRNSVASALRESPLTRTQHEALRHAARYLALGRAAYVNATDSEPF